jgi:aldose 1-epimerase
MNNTAVNTNFQVILEKFGNQQLLKLLNQNTGEYVSILPETGGMLHSLELLIGGKLIPVLDCYKTEEELLQTLGNSFKGSNLFPFPNRIDKGAYEFQLKKHQLHVNFPHENNAIHGLVFDKKFQVLESGASENAAWTKLRFCSDGKLKGYPFKFILEVCFELREQNGLTVTTSYTNTDTTNIPVAQGWHPYIQLQSNVDTFKFSFPAIKTFEVNEKMIPTGKTYEYGLFEKPVSINDTFFDSCFEVKNFGKNAEISIFDPALNDGVTIWQETGDCKYNFLQIYTPPSRKTIAIEPMTSIPDTLNNNIGLCSLAPQQSISVSWGLKKLN